MHNKNSQSSPLSRQADYAQEEKEWYDSLDWVVRTYGREKTLELLDLLRNRASQHGIIHPSVHSTTYLNTIHRDKEVPYPGDRRIERRIKSFIRWNAMAMVVRANRNSPGIGGHLSSYASLATLYEVGFNHFFRGIGRPEERDFVFFQGHTSPGVYARSFLEGRLGEQELLNFRKDLAPNGGLSSYPHPYLMPDYWEFPTVSMGLGPLMAIYQARFLKYLNHRSIQALRGKVWAFLGDGETDEPESLGSLALAGREKLDNLVFVVNCNLQRLDGPVRGNGKIIQELETVFSGAGWNVIKVVWGSDWDDLLERDKSGLLVQRMQETLDGEYQKYSVSDGAYIRDRFFGADERLKRLVADIPDDKLRKLSRGGHDPLKVYNAYAQAMEHTEGPTVILAKTIKGYGLGSEVEGRNVTHQQKKLDLEQVKYIRDRFEIPIPDDKLEELPFYRPEKNSPEMEYLMERRRSLGGFVPGRRGQEEATVEKYQQFVANQRKTPQSFDEGAFGEFFEGTGQSEVSTTMATVKLLRNLMKNKEIGFRLVPIVPDEARTFGLDSMFSQFGIYAQGGQNYDPVDSESFLFYKESKNGQILEEGITEAGAFSSFIAAGTSYERAATPMIPFYLFYSMFGFQRIGDLIWAAGDSGAQGFLIGATSGRTTLNGEGLQHQDGHSPLLSYPYANVVSYDITFAFELAVVVRRGLERMLQQNDKKIYYLTVANENYAMPSMEEVARQGGYGSGEELTTEILEGLYRFYKSEAKDSTPKAHILVDGPLWQEAVVARDELESNYQISCDIWIVTSYKELYRNGVARDRHLLDPELSRESSKEEGGEEQTVIEKRFAGEKGVVVAISDFVKSLPHSLAKWMPLPMHALGTDGFGRSDSREALREFFELDARYIGLAVLSLLTRQKSIGSDELSRYKDKHEITLEPEDPYNR